jgi:hypothetical protein
VLAPAQTDWFLLLLSVAAGYITSFSTAQVLRMAVYGTCIVEVITEFIQKFRT